ncbi:GFA family protein [Novosphingobium colocasiae]|uniref:GFA family protein n=1 Tax=Novosphingobium colocasiae TaxID=1256513 RepID=UPI0035B17576
MSSRPIHQGGCLCGQVRYSFAGDPLLVAVCHCRNCQKQSGAPFSLVGAVADADYAESGETRVFVDHGESGAAVDRHFCPQCGSPIRSMAAALPGLTIVKMGTLDRPDQWPPVLEAYCDSAAQWMPALAQQRFPRSNIEA